MGSKGESKRKEMIIKTHRLLCHAGAEKVMKYIKNNFDMEKMSETTKEMIKECEACQRRKVMTTKTKEDTKTFVTLCQPQQVAVRPTIAIPSLGAKAFRVARD